MTTNDTQTPQQLAKDKILEVIMLVVSSMGLTDELFRIQKYVNRNKLATRGETVLKAQLPHFALEFISDSIQKESKRIVKMLEEQDSREAQDLFTTLIARGVKLEEAYNMAFGITKNPAMPPTPAVAVASR